MKFEKKFIFYEVKQNIVIPLAYEAKRISSGVRDCKKLAIGGKLIIDEEGIWVRETGESYVKLNVTQEFIELNSPNFFTKTT